jgi:hypothetical protein
MVLNSQFHPDQLIVKIDVLPLECHDLSPAKAGGCGGQEHREVQYILPGSEASQWEELPDLFNGECPPLLPFLADTPYADRGIAPDEFLVVTFFESDLLPTHGFVGNPRSSGVEDALTKAKQISPAQVPDGNTGDWITEDMQLKGSAVFANVSFSDLLVLGFQPFGIWAILNEERLKALPELLLIRLQRRVLQLPQYVLGRRRCALQAGGLPAR